MAHKVKRIFNIFKKAIRYVWVKYYFLVPPRELGKGIKKLTYKLVNLDYINYENKKKYEIWIENNEKLFEYEEFEYNPLISIVIPHYNTPPKYLTKCLESILEQSYKNFEICIADDFSTKKNSTKLLKKYSEKYPQIKVVWRKENGNISAATNSAIEIATGEYIGFMDSDDVLAKDALYWNVDALNKNRDLDLIYSDEDKLDFLEKRVEPHFKPDCNPDLLVLANYITHFVVVRTNLVKELGGCVSKFDGAQDHDFLLRLTEKTQKIYHISKILYHWRMIKGSTSVSDSEKPNVVKSRKELVEETLRRRNLVGEVIPSECNSSFFNILFNNNNEKVSILLPTHDNIEYLKPCIESIYEKTTYKNFEIILIDHNSQENQSLEYFEECKKKYDNFKVIRRECEFNHSYLNNEAAKVATGEYLVFLNSDTKIITPEWIEYMLGYARQENIGCVGTKLLYSDNTIQHTGIVLLEDKVAGEIFKGLPAQNTEYRTFLACNYSAVTFACAMVSKKKFDMVNGLNEELPADYNDVDFCLEMLKVGYRNVCVPSAKLYHYESKIRGCVKESPEKYDRWIKAIEYMKNKWGNILYEDKFISPYIFKHLKYKHIFIVGARGYHYKYGGWETFVDNLVDNYEDKNTIFHISELSYKKKESINPKDNIFVDYIKVKNRGSATMLVQTIKSFKHYLQYIENNKIENACIYVLGLKLGPYLILKKKCIKELNVKIILNPDGLEWKRAKWGYFVKKFFLLSERLMFNHCDMLVCDSKGIVEYIESTYPKNKVPKQYIAYGTTNFREITLQEEKDILEKYNLKTNNYFVVICRLVPENNFELIINEFKKTNIDKELVFVSDTNTKYYKELLKRTNCDEDKRIRFLGAIYDVKALTVIRKNAFAYIHGHSAGGTNPSLLEAMGIVDLNILYDVSFNRLAGQDGCLYFNNDVGNLSTLLSDINTLESQKESLGIKAKEIIDKQFTWQLIVEKYKEIFK